MVDEQTPNVPTKTAPSGSTGKRTIAELLIGAALGMGLTGVFGPGVISWWYQPPIKDAFSCASSVQAALEQFVWMQLTVAAVVAVAALVVSYLVRRRFAKNR
jgi:Mg/Co/Ni transporter MgtE